MVTVQLVFQNASLADIFEIEDRLAEYGIHPDGLGMNTPQPTQTHDRIVREWHLDGNHTGIRVIE